ncbi:MAG: pyruvate formate lyase family protein [Acetatifactor sp.]|nr:pyruvate formate lyase family protein [Acetatifactor sp.]
MGFSNEPLLGRSVGFFYDEVRAMEALEAEGAGAAEKEEVRGLLEYWKTQETRYVLRSRYPEDIAKAMPEDIYWEHSQVAFPLYRVVGAYLDYDKLLCLGLGGMKQEVEQMRRKALEEGRDASFYEACGMAQDTLSQVCRQYGSQLRRQGREDMAVVLEKISCKPPAAFREALQLAWLYSLISGVLNYGRMDDYLGDYLERDLAAGSLTREAALEYLCCLWRLIDARKTVFHGRVIIGGRGRHNGPAADRFALLAMEASRIVAQAEPQLSLRFYKGQNPALMEKALDVIGEGKIYPMLYNDDVNIPSVQKPLGRKLGSLNEYVKYD